jgi:hypothetical protein
MASPFLLSGVVAMKLNLDFEVNLPPLNGRDEIRKLQDLEDEEAEKDHSGWRDKTIKAFHQNSSASHKRNGLTHSGCR